MIRACGLGEAWREDTLLCYYILAPYRYHVVFQYSSYGSLCQYQRWLLTDPNSD